MKLTHSDSIPLEATTKTEAHYATSTATCPDPVSTLSCPLTPTMQNLWHQGIKPFAYQDFWYYKPIICEVTETMK